MRDEKKVDTITITRSDYMPLINPVTIDVKIVEDGDGWIGWIGENDDLSIRECVSSRLFPRWKWLAKRRLKTHAVVTLDYLVDRYIIQGIDNITEGLRKCINRLRKIVSPKRRKDNWHWEMAEMEDE